MTGPVAIVHDWLTSARGGERVLESLFELYPSADLFSLAWQPAGLAATLSTRRVKTSFVQRFAELPVVGRRFRALLPLFPLAVESLRLERYSLVISSSHCVAVGALAPPSALHVAYVHSTMRYVREGLPLYEAHMRGGAVGRFALGVAAHYLRTWEATACARPDVLIANSTYTRDRILRCCRRDAEVVAPPVDVSRFAAPRRAPREISADRAYLVVSALVPYKRVDLAVRAFDGRNERLTVVGDGPERARLQRLATPNVSFLAHVDADHLAGLYSTCRALVHTAVDDFGIVMVEANAAGMPVIACAEGGALDIVVDGQTGVLIERPTVEAVRAALDRFEQTERAFDSNTLREYARQYDRAVFQQRFATIVARALSRHTTTRHRHAAVRAPTVRS